MFYLWHVENQGNYSTTKAWGIGSTFSDINHALPVSKDKILFMLKIRLITEIISRNLFYFIVQVDVVEYIIKKVL